MATRTRARTPGQATPTVTYRSKSDHVRALLKQGKTVAEVTRIVPGMGYAFAYGIAKRAGLATTAAHRRPTAAVRTDPATRIVTIRPDSGPVIKIDLATGAIKKSAA